MKRHVCFRLLASSSILILSSRTEGSWDKSNVGRLCGLEPPDDDDDDDDVAVDDAADVDDGVVVAAAVDAMVGVGWMVGMRFSLLVCWCSLFAVRCSLFVARCSSSRRAAARRTTKRTTNLAVCPWFRLLSSVVKPSMIVRV